MIRTKNGLRLESFFCPDHLRRPEVLPCRMIMLIMYHRLWRKCEKQVDYLRRKCDDMIIPTLKEHISSLKLMGSLHQHIMKSYREYMLVGGMPQAVTAFVESKDFENVDFAKEQILPCINQTKELCWAVRYWLS